MDARNGKQAIDDLISLLGGVAFIWTVMILILAAFRRTIYYDEFTHTHKLWLISIGRAPHRDFWCHYPVLGYVLALPYFRLFAESIYSIFALRLLALGALTATVGVLGRHARRFRVHWVWGVVPIALIILTPPATKLLEMFRPDAFALLLAILALSVMFKDPAFPRTALAVALSVFSVVIMPKYVFPLFLTNLAYLAYGCLRLKRVKQTLLSAASGVTGGALISHLLLSIAGTTLWENIYWTSILRTRFIYYLGPLDKDRYRFR